MRGRKTRLGSFLGQMSRRVGDAPMCRRINEACVPDAACPARMTKRSCWLVQDAACCPRNDKSRCCYCRVFLAYLDYRESGRVRSVAMESAEDPRFSEIGRRLARESRDASGPGQALLEDEEEFGR